MMFRKTSKPNIKVDNKRSKLKASSLIYTLIAIVLSVVIFFGLIVLQNNFSDTISYDTVVTSIKDVPEGTIITEENAGEYFTKTEINRLNTPANAIYDATTILNQKTKVSISGNVILTTDFFADTKSYDESLTDPVEVSVSVDSLDRADAGTLRAGDKINLTMSYQRTQTSSTTATITPDVSVEQNVADTTEDLLAGFTQAPTEESYNFELETITILENVTLSKVLDASGVEIASNDKTSIATVFIFEIEREQEKDLNEALANCSNLRVSRSVEKTE